ncbi:MAG: YqgE/AlgH family protein [Bacteroidota bacterium]|nr:YqgE/AlgH family protein [Candidatus Kapabacteria bacterium]MDW8219523.1 YqgE/AlgH family protein [Bacteroidota bacterium]
MTPSHGILLIAVPALLDPNFKRSVVFIAQHSSEGTLGYVLNRPLKATLQEVMPDLQGFDAPLYWGGPCQNDTLHCIHRAGNLIPEATEIMDGIYWGGSFDAIRESILNNDVSVHDFRFFVGYSGWSSNQLQRELNEHSWVLTPATPEAVFADSVKNFWTRTLKSMGGEYAAMANVPEHPSVN